MKYERDEFYLSCLFSLKWSLGLIRRHSVETETITLLFVVSSSIADARRSFTTLVIRKGHFMSALRFNETVLPEFLNNGWMLTLDSNRILVGWGEWSDSSVPSFSAQGGSRTCSLYAPDFYLDAASPWKRTTHWDVVERDRFATLVLTGHDLKVNPNVNGKDQGFQWVEPEFTVFERSFKEIRKGMTERGLVKGVPVVFSQAREKLGAARRGGILRSLCALPRQLYVYGFWSENEGMIGATPEVLFSKSPNSPVETMALAGTRGKSELDAGQILMRDPKERYEHQLVVNDLKNRFSTVGQVAVGTIEVLELPTLYHLMTRIQARPQPELSFSDLVKLLHPTPALGVAPRELGFSEMRRWDTPSERNRFGAPFGASGEFGDVCLVAIRNIQWQDENIRLGSGCGIVESSELEREWQELKLKRESVKRMLSI
jgi:menaquinone-specific isochorismate synthase